MADEMHAEPELADFEPPATEPPEPASDAGENEATWTEVTNGHELRGKLDHVKSRRWTLLEIAVRHLSHAQFKVFFYLAKCSKPDLSRCRPRLRVVADAIGMNRRQVAMHVAALGDGGWLVRTRRGRRGSLTTFCVPPGILHPSDGEGWEPPEMRASDVKVKHTS